MQKLLFGFGNLVQIKNKVENGREISKNLFYDSDFRIKEEQNPYFVNYSYNLSSSNPTINKTIYTYDVLDRVKRVKNPDGTNKTVKFERYNITDFDENGHKHFYRLDAFGRIVKVIEYNNDTILNISEQYFTTYSYDANDNLILITDNVGNQFKFFYDTLSRKTGMKDPDTGNWSYTYDAVGNLIQQGYGGGNLITGDGYYREYDGQNRLVRIRNGSNSTSPKIEEYYYDFRGQRVKVKKYDSANTTIYTPFKELLVIKNNSGFFNYTYIYKGDKLVARLNPDNTKFSFIIPLSTPPLWLLQQCLLQCN